MKLHALKEFSLYLNETILMRSSIDEKRDFIFEEIPNPYIFGRPVKSDDNENVRKIAAQAMLHYGIK